MKKRKIRLRGPGASGTVVSAALLRDLLVLAIEGSQRALRMRLEGRSTGRGTPPPWLEPASDFTVEVQPGSTVLEFIVPTLAEAHPTEFQQHRLFSEVQPDDTAFDYLAEALEAATTRADSALLDAGMLRFLGRFESIFDHSVEEIHFDVGGRATPVKLVRENLVTFHDLERSIPPAQYVQLAGKLDAIRHSDRTFALNPENGTPIRGVAEKAQLDQLHKHWGDTVVVAGMCHFAPSGSVLRIEAEVIRPAGETEAQLWAVLPAPLFSQKQPSEFFKPQGPRSGLNAIIGKWPGDESDADIAAALDAMS